MVETNELTRKLRTLLHPRAALIVYAEENDNHSTDDDCYFIEVRDIDENGTMGEGRPVTVEFMNELVRGYSESHSVTPYGRIPSNLLWFDPRKGSEKYIWYNPPQKRMMFFHDILKIESAEYNLPGVIYEAGENRLNVYAYTDVELTDNSDLFAAPFFNVTGASVCLGSAKIEKPKDLTYAKLLEVDELLRDKNPKPPMDSDLFISRSRKRLAELTPEDCCDAECFEYHGKQIWNGF